MDIDIARTVITVASFSVFIGICLWAYSGKRSSQFDEAANIPFADEDMQNRTVEAANSSKLSAKAETGVQKNG